MPVIRQSTYNPSFIFRNSHLNTILPNLFRKVNEVKYERERIKTPDHDFLDLDFSFVGGKKIVVVLHGLEGSSESTYMKGIVKAINTNGWDAVAINHRSCSGELNLLYSSYHSGKTDDLDLMIEHLCCNFNYEEIMLAGFSLGGNICLKYLGEKGDKINSKISVAVTVSVPCDLEGCAIHISRRSNMLYLRRFIKSLKMKTAGKLKKHPDAPVRPEDLKKVRDFYDFDTLYTAPAHGFKDAAEYWSQNSSRKFLSGIKVPALLLNALDDPFLPASCYPYEEAEKSDFLYLETPEYGGHVGFSSGINGTGLYWHERRIMEFLEVKEGKKQE